MIRDGNSLAEQIDAYIETNHSLPSSLVDVGVDDCSESYPFYYEPLDSLNYCITILQDFWDPFECGKTYYSDTKIWQYSFERNNPMKDQVLKAMKEAGKPVSAGDVTKMLNADRKEVDKAFAELKKEGAIVSPVRCKWAPAE